MKDDDNFDAVETPFSVDEWLSANTYEYQLLGQDVKEAAKDFAFLWIVFEALVCATHANARSIGDKVDQWSAKDLIDETRLDSFRSYFASRYTADGVVNERFKGLKATGALRTKIADVLEGRDTSPSGALLAFLLIVLRFRNNLLHGTKWDYLHVDQNDNFDQACRLLALAMEIHRESGGL